MPNINSLVVITGWIAVVLLVAVICKNNFPEKKELSRKIVHIGSGPVIPLAWWLGVSAEVAVPLASLITFGLLINNQLLLLPALEDVQRDSYGTVAYGLSITILLLLFWPENAAAVTAGVLVMAFGDGAAGLIGRQIRSPNWFVLNQRKSVAGTISMALISMIILLLITIISGSNIHILQICLIAFIATILEQIGPWGIDNLTVPIGVAYAWTWFT